MELIETKDIVLLLLGWGISKILNFIYDAAAKQFENARKRPNKSRKMRKKKHKRGRKP